MRIAYLNPWESAAENQAYFSLDAAARKLGHELIDCRTAEAAENARAEFVISVASSIPKVVDTPTYLTLHEPRKRFLENPFYMTNLLTYDGYLTISDSLEGFARDVAFGAGRPVQTGFYYNTPRTLDLRTNLPLLVKQNKLRIVYLGTNWDKRLPALFSELDGVDVLRIHGPRASWEDEGYRSYAGPLPFDGWAPQQAYSANGIGLVLLSADHLRDDVISNRIFEIASAGALAICPGTPWIRKWFADSVLYFDPRAAPAAIARHVLAHYRFCRNNPDRAQSMAEKARSIFERHFAAERLIENAVRYHGEMQAVRQRRLVDLGEPPAITVVIRCGGRPLTMVRQAVDSVRQQTFGRFSVVFSKYQPIDLAPLTSEPGGSICSITEVLTEGGGRAATLAAGLREVRTEYFALLDDDDFWLSDHIESLFAAARITDPNFDVAFSGCVCVSAGGTRIERALVWNRNVYAFGFRSAPRSVGDITQAFSSNCFVARSDLLVDGMLDVPQMESAEDSLLIALIARRKRPIFSYKATAFFRRGAPNESNFDALSSRDRDLMTVDLRAGSAMAPHWLNEASLQPLLAANDKLPATLIPDSTDGPEPTDPLSDLGKPLLSPELYLGWPLLHRQTLGPGALRLADGSVSVDARDRGHAIYGPYIDLPPGRYRVEAKITVRKRWPLFANTSQELPLGVFDVICLATGWTGGVVHFTADDRVVALEFELPRCPQARRVEFRIERRQPLAFAVSSLLLWSIDGAEDARWGHIEAMPVSGQESDPVARLASAK